MTTAEMLTLVRERMEREYWHCAAVSTYGLQWGQPRLDRLQTLATLLTTQLYREERGTL